VIGEGGVVREGVASLGREQAERLQRVLAACPPERRVERFEEALRVVVPAPPQVHRQRAHAGEHARAG
jgi:hypothetical protein